jgi:hypothetical protein
MSAPDPKEAWQRIQNELTRRTTRFGGGGSPAPKGLGGGIAGLVLLGGGLWVANNALFNGQCCSSHPAPPHAHTIQSTEVTAPSSTRASPVWF